MNKRIIDPLLKSRGFVKDRKTKLEKKNMKLNNIRMFYNIASIK